ncbi:hypothetical protein [Adhaeretor mobilis]|uniref:Uncharacterized protein n=1 Tax=Adhaeretor mobilis TaxID=1930276 RepID=A0A517MX52_9BACT|nr:hypothetical protein [Adhaeretor mobilis]QDS99443.1 hypothetical protein HG15A2_27660 [Adhaeretor mobilis]
MTSSLKTVIIPAIPDASFELATELKTRLGWLDDAEEVQAILGRGSHTKVIEHLRPEYLAEVTAVLESLELEYRVYNDSEAPS